MLRRTHGWAGIALALVAAGCGSSAEDQPSTRASTVTTPTTPERTAAATATTTTRTATTPAQTSTTPRSNPGNAKLTPSTTSTTPATAITTPRPKPGRSTPAKLGTPQTFSGDGDRAIGRLVLKRNAVVHWTVTGGGAFRVRDAADRLKISGRGTSGQTFAEAGDYRSVKVTASGRWTLSFATLGA